MRLFVSSKLNVLAEELNTHYRKQNCIDGLTNNTNFQQWYLLSVDLPVDLEAVATNLSVDLAAVAADSSVHSAAVDSAGRLIYRWVNWWMLLIRWVCGFICGFVCGFDW